MNRTIVITGGSGGLGLAITKKFSLTDTVICLSRTNPENLPHFIKCDVGDRQNVADAFRLIKEKYESVDILVNNAGVGISGATELLSPEKIESVMDINYLGAINCSQYALPLMKKGSNIYNISSACALFALPFRGVYCASKAALQMLSYSMRMELASFGIGVTAICPGDVKTNFTANRLKILATNEKYGDKVKNAQYKVDSKENDRMNCKSVAEKIFRLINKKHPKAMYIIGNKYKFLYYISKLLPINTFLRLTDKMFGGGYVTSKS